MSPPYDPVSRCIYCRATIYSKDDPLRKFGDEHIIPLQIRGTLVLPEASCKACELLTTGFETKVTPLFDPGRRHLGISGRRAKKKRDRLPIVFGGGQKGKLSKGEHPGTLMGFEFDYPGALLGAQTHPVIAGRVQMAPVVPDFNDRIKRMPDGFQVLIGAGVSASDFARMLAKIGHAYAVAELGIDGFEPLLLAAIKGDDFTILTQYVGSSRVGEADRGSQEHEIGFAGLDSSFVVVRVRLFANHGLATHYVVAGRTLTGSAASA